jgi:TMEM175 potassium channel family protein
VIRPVYPDRMSQPVARSGRLVPGAERGGSARLEAFSDGVLSIAATLLVLELHVPEVGQSLGAALLAQWPEYAAYVVSFATIGIIWVNHHHLFIHVRRVDRTLLFLNLGLLLVVSVIPFPTAVLGRYALTEPDSHIAAAVYGGLMILMSVAFTLLWRHVTRDARLLGGHLDPERARKESVLFSAGLVAYICGVVLAFVSAPLSLLIYGLVAVFYVFPWLPEPPDAVEAG